MRNGLVYHTVAFLYVVNRMHLVALGQVYRALKCAICYNGCNNMRATTRKYITVIKPLKDN